ncbi:MAG: lamin tail domain-containing protein [Candidatus Woesearchaeota archaeon]
MKKLIVLAMLILAAQCAAAENVIITQVLYDPAAETGSEAVELYNPTSSAIDIGGWLVSTESSASDATIPQGTVLLPKQYYLVADAGWSTSRDDLSWPIADHEEALTLANTDAGVALTNTTRIIDAVGWGNPLNIEAGFFEGTPASLIPQGNSLRRISNGSYKDTNDNSLDFYGSVPLFRNSSLQQSGAEIKVVAIVASGAPVLSDITILTDDDILPGIQIAPVPKTNKTIIVSVQASDQSGDELAYVNATMNSKTWQMKKLNDSTYEGLINMSYSDMAGNYTITVVAVGNLGSSASGSVQFEYMSLVAMEIDAAELQFGAFPGQYSEITGDTNTNTNNATLWNIGNSQIDLQLWATNLTAASYAIDISNLEYSLNSTYGEKMTNKAVTKDVNINSAEKKPLSFRLKIPTGTKPGNYTGSIFITAVKS